MQTDSDAVADLDLPNVLGIGGSLGQPRDPRSSGSGSISALNQAKVMIIIPGGAFILGHKGYVTMLCRALRSVGFLCIAVDYRYWPQTTIDGMVEDVSEAVAWSMQHCETYGGDRKQIGQLVRRAFQYQ